MCNWHSISQLVKFTRNEIRTKSSMKFTGGKRATYNRISSHSHTLSMCLIWFVHRIRISFARSHAMVCALDEQKQPCILNWTKQTFFILLLSNDVFFFPFSIHYLDDLIKNADCFVSSLIFFWHSINFCDFARKLLQRVLQKSIHLHRTFSCLFVVVMLRKIQLCSVLYRMPTIEFHNNCGQNK